MKTALVIGAASGIGQGIANTMGDMGFKVIRADINFPIGTQRDNERHIDATNDESITTVAAYLRNNSIILDHLIITIGAIDEGQATNYPEKNLYWILDINLLSPYRLVKHFIPFLRNSESPKVLLTGSAAGLGSFEDTYNLMPYIVSKHALMGYFKALRHELKKEGIQVSLFLPNRVKGQLSENSATMRQLFLQEGTTSAKGAQIANVDLADPQEIAREVIEKFLLGKTYISNNPQMIIDKLEAELSEIRKEL